MKWISVNSNDRNQLFKCSACGHIANYIDGAARGKHKTHHTAMCGYPYCPYCKAQAEGNSND